jgi:FkbM family methyltransferase
VDLLRKETVDVHTLDRLVREQGLDRVDVMKLDVEGEEGKLIEGARGVLENMRPIVLFELADFRQETKGTNCWDSCAG